MITGVTISFSESVDENCRILITIIDDTNKVSQYDTDIKKYAEQKKADWILNGGIDKEWDSYLKKMEQYGLSDYLAIKQKYFDQYQKSLSETEK